MPGPISKNPSSHMKRVRKRRERNNRRTQSSGSARVRTAPSPVRKEPNLVPSVSEQEEQKILKENNGKAKLLRRFRGQRGKGHIISVHGINASPETMDGIHERAAAQGKSVHTLAFDDMGAGISTTVDQLEGQVQDLFNRYPNESFEFVGHSMGGRALAEWGRRASQGGKLKNTVKLDLYNPMLGGTRSGNFAGMAKGILKKIPGVRPGIDMGTNSTFQKGLENWKAGPKLNVSVKVGTEDTTVGADSPHFKRAAEALGAEITEVPGAGHDDINDMADFRGR